MLHWQKYPKNPVMPEAIHGDLKVYDWRNPYVFIHENTTYAICGGNLNQRAGGRAVITLYRSLNPENTEWQYLGVIFTHPDKDVLNIECPNLFQLDDNWVLIISPHSGAQYFTGTFDPSVPAFVPENHGLIESGTNADSTFGINAYAPYSFEDAAATRMLWSWVHGTPQGTAWNDCLSLPRELTLDSDGKLLQQPIVPLQSLRTDQVALPAANIDAASERIDGFESDTFEITCAVELKGAREAGLILSRHEDDGRNLSVDFDGSAVTCEKARVPLGNDSASVELQIFFDRSVVEIFINSCRQCITRVTRPDLHDKGVSLYATAGSAQFTDLKLWRLETDRLFTFSPAF